MLNLALSPIPADLFTEMRRLQHDLNRLYETGAPGAEKIALNVWSNEDGAVVTAEMPGVKPEALDLSVVGDSLVLRGRREPEIKASEKGEWHRRERATGEFVRTVQLPFTVESGKVEAKLERGLLTVTLPRAEAEKPRKITLKS